MKWETWFRHADGTPRVLYLVIDNKTELVLADTPDDTCELALKLEKGDIRQKITFERPAPSRAAKPESQKWAVQTAIGCLQELAGLIQATESALATFQKETEE